MAVTPESQKPFLCPEITSSRPSSPPAAVERCAGLAETIVQSITATHEDLHGLLYSNILLTGASDLRTADAQGLFRWAGVGHDRLHLQLLSLDSTWL